MNLQEVDDKRLAKILLETCVSKLCCYKIRCGYCPSDKRVFAEAYPDIDDPRIIQGDCSNLDRLVAEEVAARIGAQETVNSDEKKERFFSAIQDYVGKAFNTSAPKATIKASECRECKHMKDIEGTSYCEIWHNYTAPEAFCSYHEKAGEQE